MGPPLLGGPGLPPSPPVPLPSPRQAAGGAGGAATRLSLSAAFCAHRGAAGWALHVSAVRYTAWVLQAARIFGAGTCIIAW